jgi:hypothetical protein
MDDLMQLTPFERRLGERLEAELSATMRPFDPDAVARAAKQRPPGLVRRPRIVLLAAAALLLAAGVVAVGAGLLAGPRVEPPMPWPLRGEIVPAGTLVVPAEAPMAARLHDGRVLVVTPESNRSDTPAQIWEPATGSVEPTGPTTMSRDGAQLVVLADGRVLVVGGNGVGSPPTAEIFDPQTVRFSLLASRPTTIDASAILLRDGRVLLAGGADRVVADDAGNRGVASRAEVFSPLTGQFTPVGDMHDKRVGADLYLLADGRTLVLGGAPADGVQLDDARAEVFDPLTNTFSLTDRPLLATHTYDWSVRIDEHRLVFLEQPGWGQYPDRSLPMDLAVYDLDTGVLSPGPTIPASAGVYNAGPPVVITGSRLLILGNDKVGFATGPFGILEQQWVGMLDLASGELHEFAFGDSLWGTPVQLEDGSLVILGGLEHRECTFDVTGPCMEASSGVHVLR